MKKDIAIAHEKITGVGGAQHVAFALARAFDAPIYAAWKDEQYVPDDVQVRQLFSDRSRHLLKAPAYLTDAYHMIKWSWVEELYDYDTVILNKTNTQWFVPKPDQQIIEYVHSPPRSTFDRWHCNEHGLIGRIAAIAQRAIFEHTWNYPDQIICNSETVAKRMDRYLDRQADQVVHPPVDMGDYDPDNAPTGDFYLTLGRLAHNKKVVEIVETAKEYGLDLVVAGEGPQKPEIERKAGPNTKVLGYVTEKKKIELMAQAKAFIMNASQEDFGLTPIEAMASGTPVIGVAEGHTKHQIDDGTNGIWFDRGNMDIAIELFEQHGVSKTEREIAKDVRKYSAERFRTEMRRIVNESE